MTSWLRSKLDIRPHFAGGWTGHVRVPWGRQGMISFCYWPSRNRIKKWH